MKLPINKSNGVLEGQMTVDEFIDYLKGHKSVYGNTLVRFLISGDEEVKVQFDHYKNAITIDVYEDFD